MEAATRDGNVLPGTVRMPTDMKRESEAVVFFSARQPSKKSMRKEVEKGRRAT